MRTPSIKAWTGGSMPRQWREISRDERVLVRALFREQRATWQTYWEQRCPLYICRIFWGRARADAHATLRGQGR